MQSPDRFGLDRTFSYLLVPLAFPLPWLMPPLVVAPVPDDDVPPVDDAPVDDAPPVPADPLPAEPLPKPPVAAPPVPAAKARLLDAVSTAARSTVLKFMILSLLYRTEDQARRRGVVQLRSVPAPAKLIAQCFQQSLVSWNSDLRKALCSDQIWKEAIMRFRLALSTAAIACATAAPILTTTPASAYSHSAYVRHHRLHHSWKYYRDYSGYMDPRSGHYDPEFQRNRENFGFSGRDPSRVGGVDPSLHPAPVGQ